eukprot:3010028-Prymnesium_polylepis.1
MSSSESSAAGCAPSSSPSESLAAASASSESDMFVCHEREAQSVPRAGLHAAPGNTRVPP